MEVDEPVPAPGGASLADSADQLLGQSTIEPKRHQGVGVSPDESQPGAVGGKKRIHRAGGSRNGFRIEPVAGAEPELVAGSLIHHPGAIGSNRDPGAVDA